MNALILIFLGLSWGLSFTLSKLAIENGGTPIGITFWQSCISGFILFFYILWKHKKITIGRSNYRFLLIVTFLAAIFPNIILYSAALHLEAGILSISVSLVPLFTYLLALIFNIDTFSRYRVFGLFLGFLALLLLILPENSLPETSDVPWLVLSLIGVFCYAIENVYIDRSRPKDIGPVRLVFAINFFSIAITLPLSLVMGHFFVPNFSNPILIYSVLGLGVISAAAYSMFIYLISKAGSVFASQTGYLVTLFGVFWGMFLLNEAHSYFVWGALVLIMMGIFLVQPRNHIKS